MATILKKIFFLSLCFFAVSCATHPTKPAKTIPSEKPLYPASENKPQAGKESSRSAEPQIDFQSIQRLLHLDLDFKKLGYFEKSFNTCQTGFGYSTTEDCQKKTFVVIHFRLMCRDSEGTISEILTDQDLTPVAHQKISWFLKNANGQLQTDSDGFGQVVVVSNESQKGQRLRLSNDQDFLLLRAGDVRQLTVPKNWCTN